MLIEMLILRFKMAYFVMNECEYEAKLMTGGEAINHEKSRVLSATQKEKLA